VLGVWLSGRVSTQRARAVTLAMAAAGGLAVLVSAASG
jgi:hypothetical protein